MICYIFVIRRPPLEVIQHLPLVILAGEQLLQFQKLRFISVEGLLFAR